MTSIKTCIMVLVIFLIVTSLKSQPLQLENAGTENDALLLRKFFNEILDYGALECKGYFWISTVGVNLVLSSDKEILAYVSSPTGLENLEFKPNGAHVFRYDLPFPDGRYEATFFDPKTGAAGSRMIRIKSGETRFRKPVFVDDMAVHIIK